MTSTPIDAAALVLLDQLIQDFQGVLLSIHAACEPITSHDPVRSAVDVSLDLADRVLENWRDRVRSAGEFNNPIGSVNAG
jgi:hypothetical protein